MMEEKKPRLLRADEIETRVGQANMQGIQLLLYKTARTDMDILDELYGTGGWSNDYREIKGNLYCGICVNGIWKWDCGTESNTEAEKGEASDAFKRAGTRWGIGRELYSAPFIWINAGQFEWKKGKEGKTPKDEFAVAGIEYKDRKIVALQIKNCKNNTIVYDSRKPNWKSARNEAALQTYTCADCGKVIEPFKNFSAAEVADRAQKQFGRALCLNCGKKAAASAQREVQNVQKQFDAAVQPPVRQKSMGELLQDLDSKA